MRQLRCSLALVAAVSAVAAADEWRGLAAAEFRGFPSSPPDSDQYRTYTSIAAEPEYYRRWHSGRQSLTIRPFYRWDLQDEVRTHADMREFFWLYAQDGFEFTIGVRKVFWGATESQHLVDVINQTDLVEGPDGEEKLGQPMISATLLTGSGAVHLYLLPYFRERTFPGEAGRLRSLPRVETAEPAQYEDGDGRHHLDRAVRWSILAGNWDIGLSYFSGTNREPELVLGVNAVGEAVLVPFYRLIHQTGIDAQGAEGAWLLKLEAIDRRSRQAEFFAATAGFEYTFYDLLGRGLDAGIVMEYLYDERGDVASQPFAHDLMVGLRLTLNDAQSSEFLLAVIKDRDESTRMISLEASRRLTEHLKLVVEGWAFAATAANDPLYSFRQDDFLQLGLNYFF